MFIKRLFVTLWIESRKTHEMTNTIEHQGVIISIDGSIAHVKIEQTSACASCHVKTVCGASEKSEKIIDANIISSDLKVGDTVIVIGQKSLGFKAIILAYILPFVLIYVINKERFFSVISDTKAKEGIINVLTKTMNINKYLPINQK